MLGDTLLYIKYGENDIRKDKTAVKCHHHLRKRLKRIRPL